MMLIRYGYIRVVILDDSVRLLVFDRTCELLLLLTYSEFDDLIFLQLFKIL